MRNDENGKPSVESISFDNIHLRITECWSEQDENQATEVLMNAVYETSNPLDDNTVVESEERSTYDQALGLENILITDSDNAGESNIEFCYSTPENMNDLTPILDKWSPRINNVTSTSIIEDLISSSDDEEVIIDEEDGSNHVIYIDEASVKQEEFLDENQEEFLDENSEEDFNSESNKSSKIDKKELSGSFDEEKVKKQFNISDNLRIKLYKLDINVKSINNYQPNLKPSSKIARKTTIRKKTSSSSSRKKLPQKSPCLKTLPKNSKTPPTTARSIASHSEHSYAAPEHSTAAPKRTNAPAPQPKSQNTTRIETNNKRHSLRLSGIRPEFEVSQNVPCVSPRPPPPPPQSLTRSGKKRVFEEPKSKSTNSAPVHTIDEPRVSLRSARTCVKKEPRSEETPRSRSPPPLAYKKNFDVIFVCQCCDKKYASVEHVKAHIRTHFPNSTTN